MSEVMWLLGRLAHDHKTIADFLYEKHMLASPDQLWTGAPPLRRWAENQPFWRLEAVTTSIPIVAVFTSDPVARGFVARLNHPGKLR